MIQGPALDSRWSLLAGDDQVGELRIAEYDMPWVHATFIPGEAWERYAALFHDQSAAFAAGDYEAAAVPVGTLRTSGLRLVADTGDATIELWIIFIDGDRARFRF